MQFMTRLILALIVGLFGVVHSTSLRQSQCQITTYVLAIEDLCGFESIHGLWPDPEQTCDSCTNEAFSTSKLSKSTLDRMKKEWPSCKSGTSNEDFWGHEWSKHGTCSGMTQEKFFSTALDLFDKYQSDCKGKKCNICFTPTLQYQGVCPTR